MKHLLLLVALAAAACAERPTPIENRDRTEETVSIVRLLSDPEAFDGDKVMVMGYLQLEFETYALWLHREDRVHGLLPNRIDLEASACGDKLDQVNERYVLLEGTFTILGKSSKRPRYMLQSITRCQSWAKAKGGA